MTKKGAVRTTVYIPYDLHNKAKDKGIKISNFLTTILEHEIYRDNPRFIEDKLNLKIKQRHHSDKEIELLKEDLKKANETQQQRKDRIKDSSPGVKKTYRTIIPKGGD